MSDLKNFNAMMRSEYTQNHLATVLGDKRQQFVTNLSALVSNDKKLQECEPATIMHAAITATALELPLDKNLGFAYVIPYQNKRAGVSEAQFQLGAKGITQLAIRSGQFVRINVSDVREGELKGFNRLSGDITFDWDETAEREKKKVVGYVAYFRLVNGFSKTMYMSVDEIEAHAKRYSQTYGSKNDYVRSQSKWSTDFDAMAQKTILKRLLTKYAPLSVEMQTAFQADQSVQREAGAYSYVDNDAQAAKAEIAERAKERATEDAEYSDDVAEHPEATATEPAKPIDPNVNDLPFED